MNVFDQMKSECLSKYPNVKTLGPLWRFKVIGARKCEQTVTWEKPNPNAPKFPDSFSQTFVTVSVKGKEYLLKFGRIQ